MNVCVLLILHRATAPVWFVKVELKLSLSVRNGCAVYVHHPSPELDPCGSQEQEALITHCFLTSCVCLHGFSSLIMNWGRWLGLNLSGHSVTLASPRSRLFSSLSARRLFLSCFSALSLHWTQNTCCLFREGDGSSFQKRDAGEMTEMWIRQTEFFLMRF